MNREARANDTDEMFHIARKMLRDVSAPVGIERVLPVYFWKNVGISKVSEGGRVYYPSDPALAGIFRWLSENGVVRFRKLDGDKIGITMLEKNVSK